MSTVVGQRSVPFFNYPKFFTQQEDEILEVVREVGRRGAFILQKDLAEFEAHLAEYTGAKHAIGLANATDALIIALRAAGVKPGDEVIFPSHTMVASPSSAHFVGATPVPVDIDEIGMMDPNRIEDAITPNTRVIMPVQLNGRTCDMDAILDIAQRHDLIIVEDSAQGLGSRYKGKHAGTFGVAGCFSFYPAKILGSLGDGGALITNDDEVARLVHLYRDHGRDAKTGEVEMWGLNSRLDNLQAAILELQFKKYDTIVNRRRAIASIYQERLGDVAELRLPPAPDADADHFDTYQNYELEADRRDDLRTFLRENGIGTLIQWGGKAVHQFEKLGFNVSLPNTEAFFRRCIMLPMNMMIDDADVHYVCDKVREFYRA